MRKENIPLMERRLDFRNKFQIDPQIFDKLSCKKCSIRTLVVADGFLYFNDENFGLSDFVDIITTSHHPSANIIVTKAHRENPGSARLNGADPNFKFTTDALANIDVVFMFAADRASPLLSPEELKVLAIYMDDGGGVFATGDHDWLGRAMCGDLMRVRSMRKWFFDNPGPFGEPVAPAGNTVERHDTNREGHDAGFEFNDQSDDVAQEIMPIYETVGTHFLKLIKEPHPILCGPNGVLKYLPDHPHEGECIVPWEEDRTFDYDGASFDEYPLDSNGERPLPKVIAMATMIPGAETASKPPIPGGAFGVMSAYDGQLADVGRVHCDATWHHFININLTGDSTVNTADPKSLGFLATPAGEAVFEDIKSYFANIAVWLAPKEKQTCMRNRWLWNVIRLPEFDEHFGALAIRSKKLTLKEAAKIGQELLAFSALNMSKCQILRSRFDLVIPELIKVLPKLACKFDPCIPNPKPGPDPLPFVDPEIVLDAALGNLAFMMFQESKNLIKDNVLEAPNSGQMAKLEFTASRTTLQLFGKELENSTDQLSKVASALKRM